MPDKSLKFSQMLTLLPVTVPEAVLDFLEGIEAEENLQKETFLASLETDYYVQNKDRLLQGIAKMRADFQGKIAGVQVEPYGKDLPNAYWCKLTGETFTRGIGFIVKSRLGPVGKVEFQDSDFDDRTLAEKLGR